ncbi:MAG: AarF/ABC1/UbiB kinase family protein [Chloroflexi bacterium]|nr:AarF/ABC1/UbiB kinase family protein [Chloroflexota bacterium]
MTIFHTRYRRIVLFSARVVISLIAWELILPRLGFRKRAQQTRSDRLRRIAAAFRALAIEMGGVLIKVGQFLSSRLDVLPIEITAELADLQDEVPAEDFADIRRVVETELGTPLLTKFARFDEVPLAAASLGQAHCAELKIPAESTDESLTTVVVKIQRPNIETIVATDLAALRTVGKWLHRYPPIRKRADIPMLLDEFSHVLHEEIDYLAEGRNAETFAANFADRPDVLVPRVAWTHTTRRVLALENVFGIKITDYDAITAAGVDRAEVARRLFDTYLKQIFDDGFFHADPHPGNLFVFPGDDEGNSWRLTFVDFGMAGRVPPNLRAGLREGTIAIGTRDAGRMIKAYEMMGVLLPHADLELLEKAEAQMFERFWGKSMAELQQISHKEMVEFAREFRELIYTMPFQVPQDLILLGRTIAILSGICTGLDPQFNIWESVVPFAQKLIAEEALSGWEFWVGELGGVARALLTLPRRTEAVLGQMERGEIAVRVPQLSKQMSRLEQVARRMVGSVVFAAMLLGGVQLHLADQMVFSGVLFAGAGLALLSVIFARRDMV